MKPKRWEISFQNVVRHWFLVPSFIHSRKEGDLLDGLGASANRPFMALQVPKKRKRIKQTKATSSEWMRDFMVISPSVR